MKMPTEYRYRIFAVVVCVCLASLSHHITVLADEPASLNLVPADAAFYSASAHLREQFDALMDSRAVAKLREMPFVQMGLGWVQATWNDPEGDLAPLKAMYEQPENKQLVELLIDAVSHEVFVYGDESFADLLSSMNEFNRANQAAVRDIRALEDNDRAEQVAAKFSKILAEHLDDVQMPDTVIGFRLSDTEPALAQLARLEQTLGMLLADRPDLKQRLSREKIAGGDFVTMQLDGSLIPWDAFAEGAGFDIAEIRDTVNKKKASLAIGVKDQYLLVSIGKSNDHLASLGQGEVLANREELAPLRRHARQQICSVAYASDAFMKETNSAERQLDQLVAVAESLIPLSDLDASLQEQLREDARGLIADIKKVVPEPGAVTSFAFNSDRGYEGYSYDWGEHKLLDASQPLTILEHAGGDPILVVAGRGKCSPETYDTISKWIGRAIYYGETIGVENLGTKERDFYQRVRGDLEPLVKQLDQITRDKLVPAFRDGQRSFVLDAKITSKQWYDGLPPAEEPLPMLEFGWVCGVSDANLVKEASADYFHVVQKVIDTLHNAEPTTIPDLRLPLPESRAFPDGTVYYYRLPAQLRLDKQISPNAGLSDDTFVLSLTPKTTARLLRETPLAGNGVIERHQGAAGAAMQFSISRLIDAVAPWVDYGVGLSGQEVDDATLDQIHTGLEIARCLRSVSSVTYQEDGIWVTHFEAHLQDLPQ